MQKKKESKTFLGFYVEGTFTDNYGKTIYEYRPRPNQCIPAIPAFIVERDYVHKGRIKTEIVIFRSKIWNELSEKITKKEMDAIRNLSLELEMRLELILKRKHRKEKNGK